MLVLRRQEELGVQIYIGIDQVHIFIAISGVPEVARGVPGPGGGPPHFLTNLDLFKRRHNSSRGDPWAGGPPPNSVEKSKHREQKKKIGGGAT